MIYTMRKHVTFLVRIYFECLVYITTTGGVPTFTQQPSSPTFVEEGKNLTLQWTYNIDGAFRGAEFLDVRSGGAGTTITAQDSDGLFVKSTYLNRLRVNITDSQTSISLLTVHRSDKGSYRFEVENKNRDKAIQDVEISVLYEPNITYISGNQVVNESDTVNLMTLCKADGEPAPNITWTRVSDNSTVPSPLNITGKQDEGGYRCTASNGVGNPDSRIINISVEYYGPINTKVTTDLRDNTVVLNTTFNINCSAQANPAAKYRFYEGTKNFKNDTTGSDVAVISTSVSERVKQVNYSCIPFNYYGDGEREGIAVIVQYAPGGTNLTTVPSNRTLLRGSIVSLNCETDASPEADYHFYFNGTSIGKNGSGVLSVTVDEDGEYACVPINTVGTGDNVTVSITAVVAPSVEISPPTANVVEGNSSVLTCNPSGKPEPVLTWTELGSSDVLSNTSSLPIVNVSRPGKPDNTIQYQCTASNGIGTPATATATINVYYRPGMTTLTRVPNNRTLLRGTIMSLNCETDASPEADYYFFFNGNSIGNSRSGVLSVTVDKDGVYTCVPINTVGTGDNDTVDITAVDPQNEALVVNAKIKITNVAYSEPMQSMSTEPAQNLTKRLKNGTDGVFKNHPFYNETRVNKYENGSVVAFFTLIFNKIVNINETIALLVKAAENGTLGDLQVDPGSIKAIRPVVTPATSPSTQATSPLKIVVEEKGIKLWMIIAAVVGGVILLAVVVGIVTWCVHKKRKCRRKDTKVHVSESEEQGFVPGEDSPYSQDNNGYADAGPRATEMTNMVQNQGASAPAAVPDYAVVDRKGAKNDEKAAEQKPPVEAQYAEVDKSKKKKKKEEPDATYAQVDMSKKTKKKKPKPGEVLYADLGEFNQMKEMPKVATSPEVLPPIKKPTPYVETQYADITQFLKGDATLPENKDSQETATGTKEEAPAADTSEGGETNNETFF